MRSLRNIAERINAFPTKLGQVMPAIISLIICSIFFLSCSFNNSAKIIEQYGDPALKSQTRPQKNNYIGFSQSNIDYESAFNNAIINAHKLISNELGFNISVSTTDISVNVGTMTQDNLTYYIQQEINIQSEHNIKSKINRIYQEKVLVQNIIYNRVWVELFFDIDHFYREYYDFWINNIGNLPVLSNITIVPNLEILLTLKPRFEEEKRYLPNKIISDYENLYNNHFTFFNSFINNVNVINTNNNHKFSNNFIFKITYNNTVLPNFPVTINNINYITNNQGLLNYIADYEKEIVLLAGHTLNLYFPLQILTIYRNDTFSPHFPKNVTLKITSNEESIRNTFTRLLQRKGYKVGESYDLNLLITKTENTQHASVNQYITNLRLSVDIRNNNNRNVALYQIPNNPNEYIKGHGITEPESRYSAYRMDWFTQIEQEITILQGIITKAATP